MFSQDIPIEEVVLAFLDVETTGLHPEYGDRVCEIAILRCRGDEVLDALQQLVYPQREMGAGAYAIHGISDEMLRDAPPFEAVVDDVLECIRGAVLVGHNTAFDLGFLQTEFALLDMDLPSLLTLDTMRLARACYRLRSYALQFLAQTLGIEIAGQQHRAMGDVLLTRALFGRLISDLPSLGTGSLAYGRRPGRPSCSLGDVLRVQGGPVTVAPAPRLPVPPLVRDALREGCWLHLRYLSERGTETERLVRPLRVCACGGNLSLVAYCSLRDALRYFRLDRILEMDLVRRLE